MRRTHLIFALVVFGVLSRVFSAVARPVPRTALMERIKDGIEIYGIVHWGLNTYTDREWGYGDENPAMLNPDAFDADQIVGACKDGGLQGLIVVAKHHDGFCLWPTKTTEHNIAKSPFRGGKGDYVKEMERACRKHGLKFGVYVSPWDRNRADYATPKYVKAFHAQIKELLSGDYGEIFEMWFDGANGGDGWYGGAKETRKIQLDYYRFDEVFKFVRELQPKVCIFNEHDGADCRWPGNERGELLDDSAATIRSYDPEVYRSCCNRGDLKDGTTFHPPECDFPLRKGWFYHASETNTVRCGEYLMQRYLKTVGNGGTMNIGIAPDRHGRLAPEDVAALKRFGELRREFFSRPSSEKYNVIVLAEDVSKGEQVGGWKLMTSDKQILAEGTALGIRRIRVLPNPVSVADTGFEATSLDGLKIEHGIKRSFYYIEPKTLNRVMNATTMNGETDTARWMTRVPVWIGEKGNDAPAFVREFRVDGSVRSAELRISGLGFYEAYLNGRRIGDRELEPTPTDYTKRVYYSTYAITNLVRGANSLKVLLGNGWYNSAETGIWRFDKAPWRGFPRLWADLAVTFADGSRMNVVTDSNWEVAPSPVLFNDFREGEIIRSESRSLPPLKEPRRVQVVSAPKGRLLPETHEPARVVERIRPVAIEKFGDGWILDFGKNLAGRVRMDVRGAKEGDVVSFRYDERKPPTERHIDCFIHAVPSTNAWKLADAGYQTDRFICNGDAVETYAPRFTYHGFRYVLVRGLRTAPAAEDSTAEFIRTDYDVEDSSLLVTSDETFNKIIRAAALAYDCNFTDGFPTDCPHREKNGWLGDAALTATFGLYRAGTESALRDWTRLIAESQRPNGSVPCIVPDFGWEYDGHSCCNSGPGWGTALTTLPTILHRIRGERDFLVEMYPAMRRYCECLWKDLEDGLIVDGLPDWMAAKLLEPDKCWTPRTPAKLTSTAYAYRSFLETADAADLAGRPDDAAEFRRRADVVKAAFNREFHRGNGVYHEGWACGQAFALNFGLVDAKDVEGARRQLVKAVHAEDDHIDFGMLGTSVVFRELSKAGETALAYKMIMNTAPSFADWIRSGDTTLREDFPGKLSRNHPSFGDFAAWAYEYILGVRAAEPGYRKFVFDPKVRDLPLAYARAKVRLAKGLDPIEASWRRDPVRDEIVCRLVVPRGTVAEVPRLGKTLGPGAHEFTLPSEPADSPAQAGGCRVAARTIRRG